MSSYWLNTLQCEANFMKKLSYLLIFQWILMRSQIFESAIDRSILESYVNNEYCSKLYLYLLRILFTELQISDYLFL